MKRMISKVMISGVTLCLLPATMQAQLIVRGEDAQYNLDQVPHHASDFFNYNAAQMYYPYENQYTEGYRWGISIFSGTRKPTDMKVEVSPSGNWTGLTETHYTYAGDGRILTKEDDNITSRYTYDADNSLIDVDYQRAAEYGYRADAFVGRVLSWYTQNKPEKVMSNNKALSVTYSYDSNGRVSRADLLYTYDKPFRGAIDLSPQVTFDYTYDNADNIVKIAVYRYLREEKENNAVLMNYDDKNRLVEVKFVGDKNGTSRRTYQYDERGAVVKVDQYDYYTPETLDQHTSIRYDIQRDTKGRIVSLQRNIMTHHYGSGDAWSGMDDIWKKSTFVTYDYDQYDNWTTLKLYSTASEGGPYCTVRRILDYTARPAAGTATSASPMSAPAAKPEFTPIDDETRRAFSPVNDLINAGNYDEAEKLNAPFLKSDKTGTALTRQAVILCNKKQYDECIEVAKKAIDALQAGNHDYRYVTTILIYAVLKPYSEYIKAYNEPGHDAKTLNAFARKAIDVLEYIGRKDPHNYANWRLHLAELYQSRINATDDTAYYRKKLEALQSTGTVPE